MNGQERSVTSERDPQEGWNTPAAQEVPEPTYWPAMLAMGIALLLWGVATSWLISGAGLVLTVLSLIGWIRELVHGE
jgi:hypothetical protein